MSLRTWYGQFPRLLLVPVLMGVSLSQGWSQQLRGAPRLLPLEESKQEEVESAPSEIASAPMEVSSSAEGEQLAQNNQDAQADKADQSVQADEGGQTEASQALASAGGETSPAIDPAESVSPAGGGKEKVVPVAPAIAQENGGGGDGGTVQLPYTSIFRGTGGPIGSNLLNGSRDPLGLGVSPNMGVDEYAGHEAKVGDGSASVSVRMPGVHLDTPSLPYVPFLQRGFAPEDAHLKLGPIYVRFGELTGALLASDNVNLDAVNRDSGCISLVQLGVTVIAQLTEGWQFALSGLVSYLPFQSKVGVDVTTGLDFAFRPFLLGVDYSPLLKSQLSYRTMIGDWPLIFADEVKVTRGWYANDTRDDFYRFDARSTSGQYEDRAGRYVFAAPYSNLKDKSLFDRLSNGSFKQDNFDLTFLSNVASVATARLLPREVQVTARAYREDLWFFNKGTREDLGLPNWRDVANVEMSSQRENLRFKPFGGYEVVKTSQMGSGADQTVYGGLRGPITDQLSLYSRIGLTRAYSGEERLLWYVSLDHQAGPYTSESLSYSRDWSEFHDEISQDLEYRIKQILGPDLIGTFYAIHRRVENRFGELTSANDTRLGLRLTYTPSPKTEMLLGATVAQSDNNAGNFTTRTWTIRYDLHYQITDALTAQLLYQYQKSESEQANSSYYENLVILKLTKTFR